MCLIPRLERNRRIAALRFEYDEAGRLLSRAALPVSEASDPGRGERYLWTGREWDTETCRMALPESLTSDSQPPFCHSSWLHEPRVLLAPTLTSSGLDAAWPVVDLMSANRDEEPFV